LGHLNLTYLIISWIGSFIFNGGILLEDGVSDEVGTGRRTLTFGFIASALLPLFVALAS